MIFNGGKNRIDGQLEFSEFYETLQKYYDDKQNREQGAIKQDGSAEQSILDQVMLDKIIENLFRVLTDDLFKKSNANGASKDFLVKKVNLMKVLLEMLNLIEVYPIDDNDSKPLKNDRVLNKLN